ncbi:PQQ-dependent sugar dehydrogenase [Nocardioides montaniterrae]
MRRRLGALAALTALALTATGCSQGGNEVSVHVEPSMTAVPTDSNSVPETFDGIPDVVGTAATGLTNPWGLDFLPNGVAVVTERTTGRVLLITPPAPGQSKGTVTDLGRIQNLDFKGDGGLLGVAVSPSFVDDQSLYFYESTHKDNRVVRMPLTDAGLGQGSDLITGIPHGATHNGGSLRFGADGYLYIGTGDAGHPAAAQAPKSLAGKILRIGPDGKAAPGNPKGNIAWASGFRDVLGLAFDGDGQLWATDAGPTQDELDRIMPGDNAGWPRHEGEGGPKKFVRPSVTWSPGRATPGGLSFAGGYLWLSGVNGQDLWRIRVEGGEAGDTTPYFHDGAKSTYGALRAVGLSPDGRLWLATDNAKAKKKSARAVDQILLIRP